MKSFALKHQTVIKSLTWTLIAGVVGACLARCIFTSFDLGTATVVFFFAARAAKLVLYYFHEKAWNRLQSQPQPAPEVSIHLEARIEELGLILEESMSGRCHVKVADLQRVKATLQAAQKSL